MCVCVCVCVYVCMYVYIYIHTHTYTHTHTHTQVIYDDLDMWEIWTLLRNWRLGTNTLLCQNTEASQKIAQYLVSNVQVRKDHLLQF